MRRSLLLATALLAAPLIAQTISGAGGQPRYLPWGLELADMDPTVKPGDDFFAYAEGMWLRNHPIPADKSSAGYNSDLPDEIEGQVRAIVETAAAHPATATQRKVGDFYAAWMDERGIEARGLAPLRPWLARLDAVRTRPDLGHRMMKPG